MAADPPSPAKSIVGGTWRAAPADATTRRTFHDESLDDADWEAVRVPGHWRSTPAFTEADGPLLYRTRFDVDRNGHDRSWLVLDGIFYTSDVWLDGTYLGDTEGYFFPHSFEVTDQIRDRDTHLLALEVACAPQTDRTRKRNLTGVFQHWDLLDQDWNPGGIWRPVRIEHSGPVRIRHMRVVCRDANEQIATLFLRVVLDTVEARTVRLRTTLAPAGTDRVEMELVREQRLAAGENRLEWTMSVPDPKLWWPAALGDQPLYDVVIEVLGEGDESSDRRQRRTGLRRIEMRNWICSVNGERIFLKGSNQGPTRMALAEATPQDLRREVTLAREAGLDMLRMHAHVSRPELYEAADEQGLLLWQDLPLQWGYARSVRHQARRQAREAVDLLAHHPSVAIWCGHNEPLAIDVAPEVMSDRRRQVRLVARAAAGMFLPTWNKSILDRSIRSVLDHDDGSRPVVPHSGVLPHPPQLDGTDTHLYFGWYHGDERDLPRLLRWWPRLARFVTEFGAQAVPDDASFLEPERWPDLDWGRARHTHSLQKEFFDRHVPPAEYESFESWREATQAYQAELIRHHIQTLRRLKYRPCGGFAQFCFGDGYPSVTWSVLDHERRPKAGYTALVDACRPVIVVADRLPGRVAVGQRLHVNVHVVNDLHTDVGNLIVRARLERPDDPGGAVAGPWGWAGEVPADTCVRIGRIDCVVPKPEPGGVGRLRLVLELGHPATTEPLAATSDTTVVTADHT